MKWTLNIIDYSLGTETLLHFYIVVRYLPVTSPCFQLFVIGFRRNWGTYEAIYLFAKLSALFVVAVVDSDNCFFRTLSRSAVPIARQVLLLLLTLGFFVAQCVLGPFLDPVNNASEWISRLNYVMTAALALAVALNIPGQSILETYVLYASVLPLIR
jgi:hypothetical protein